MGSGYRLSEGFRFNTKGCNLEISQKSFYPLYADQRATVLTDVESDEFEIARGTKLGYLLSSLLSHSVLLSAMEKDNGTWNEKGKGHQIGRLEKRFHIQPAICWRRSYDGELSESAPKDDDFRRTTEAQRLEIHPPRQNKCSHQSGLAVGKIKYLGQMITFMDQETTEVQHRLRCAWSVFAEHRQELTSKSCLLRHRFHLFDAVVTPTIMYGAGTWTTAEVHEKTFVQHSAECFDSSFRRKENTEKKLWRKRHSR